MDMQTPDSLLADLPGSPRTAANPPGPGPGYAPGNVDRTVAQSDPGSIGGGTLGRPERYLVVARHVDPEDGGAPPRYLLVRWQDWPRPALLSLAPPAPEEGLAAAVSSVLWSRAGVTVIAAPRVADARVPARMTHPRTGVEGLGWLRAVAVDVTGEPAPDALLAGIDGLSEEEALDALSTDVERVVFRAGVAAE